MHLQKHNLGARHESAHGWGAQGGGGGLPTAPPLHHMRLVLL